MKIKDILYQRRKELDLTLKQVADMVGVSEGTVSRWESGEIENMKRDKIVKYAKALQISPAVIMGWEEHNAKSVKIPVVGQVAAGLPIDAIEDVIDYEEIPEAMTRCGEYFGLRIKGDSMLPRMMEGDVVIVRQQPDAESGDVVVVQVNGDTATCKRLVKHENGISLVSFNPAYTPMVFTAEQVARLPVTIIGKVVENRQKY